MGPGLGSDDHSVLPQRAAGGPIRRGAPGHRAKQAPGLLCGAQADHHQWQVTGAEGLDYHHDVIGARSKGVAAELSIPT